MMNSSMSQPSKDGDPKKPTTHEPAEAPKHEKDEKLDQALEDSFPASDPVSP